jgi:serine/threonine-protein kinase
MTEPGPARPLRTIIPAGTRLNGIYEIDEPLAAGGMGEIYKGHVIETGDLVAIKLIRSDIAQADSAFALFRKEAAALRDLYHEAIVRYFVFSVDPVLERPYLAMEFVDGKSVSGLLRSGPLAYEAVERLMHRVAAGLQAAHEHGIIHRDVSPDNIIVPAGDMGRAKIIDFGIARSTRLDRGATIIGTGFAGKHNYVSPEQLGLYGGEVTPKSDIYSLGLVLAEALRGTPIDMGGTTLEVVEKRRQVPELDGIDPRLRPLIERMLRPDPAERPSSMAEIATYTPDAPEPGARADRRGGGAARAQMPRRPPAGRALDHDVLGPNRSKFMNGIESRSSERDAGGKPIPGFPHPALVAVSLFVGVGASAGTWLALRAPTPPTISESLPAPRLEAQAPAPRLGPTDLAALGLAPLPHAQSPTRTIATEGRGAEAARFIDRFDGGECFFVRTIATSDTSATAVGFGHSVAPFHALDEAFRMKTGFEADIGVHPVSEAQCPALAFLRALDTSAASRVTLDLASRALEIGQTLAGTLAGLDGRAASVLVVTGDGEVRPVPTQRSGTRDTEATFSLATTPDLGTGDLLLVVAIASREALSSLRDTTGAEASRLFPEALEEARRRHLPLAAAAVAFEILE